MSFFVPVGRNPNDFFVNLTPANNGANQRAFQSDVRGELVRTFKSVRPGSMPVHSKFFEGSEFKDRQDFTVDGDFLDPQTDTLPVDQLATVLDVSPNKLAANVSRVEHPSAVDDVAYSLL